MSAAPIFNLFPDGEPPTAEPLNVSDEVFPSPGDPMAVIRALMPERTEDGVPTLRQWRGSWMNYVGPHWAEAEELAVRAWLYERLEHGMYEKVDGRSGDVKVVAWQPTKAKVSNLTDALQTIVHLPQDNDAPCWTDTGAAATNLIPCANGLLDVESEELIPATPRYFGTVSVPFDYDPKAEAPTWLAFLQTLWPDDQESIDVLQKWFGYVLSGRTNLHKALLMYGPKRSGKGTISTILMALMGGSRNVPGCSMASLGTNFGLQPLLGKPLAIIGDARMPRENQAMVIERILNITGGDPVQVDRKNREQFSGRMPTRLLLLSNELPKFTDAAAAIASRFVMLHTKESFLGREDLDLEGKLLAEMPGILRWAMRGLVALNEAGRIDEPASVTESRQQFDDLVSPISQFVREECIEGADCWVELDQLFKAWQAWNVEQGTGATGKPRFKSDLLAAFPTLIERRPNGKRRGVQGLGLAADPEYRQPFGRTAPTAEPREDDAF